MLLFLLQVDPRFTNSLPDAPDGCSAALRSKIAWGVATSAYQVCALAAETHHHYNHRHHHRHHHHHHQQQQQQQQQQQHLQIRQACFNQSRSAQQGLQESSNSSC
jgi:hypothetical protein